MFNMTSKKVVVRVSDVYGEIRFYPTCEIGKTFASIAGTITLTDSTRDGMKKLGYTFEVETTHYEL